MCWDAANWAGDRCDTAPACDNGVRDGLETDVDWFVASRVVRMCTSMQTHTLPCLRPAVAVPSVVHALVAVYVPSTRTVRPRSAKTVCAPMRTPHAVPAQSP